MKALSTRTASAFDEGRICIVVDAGHGGIDGGVSGRSSGVKESDINLAISLALKESLEDMGFEVKLTRKTEAGLYGTTTKGFKKRDMQRRKEIIAEANPDLLISVHQNFYPSAAARGGQVFYAAKKEESKRLAALLQEKLNELYGEVGVRSRTISAGEYFMLGCHPCPSVIVECGFLSNAADERLLRSSSWREKIAGRLAMGALAYFSDQSG